MPHLGCDISQPDGQNWAGVSQQLANTLVIFQEEKHPPLPFSPVCSWVCLTLFGNGTISGVEHPSVKHAPT